MYSGRGDSLQGVGLSKGNTQVTTGTFGGATTFHCHVEGEVSFTYEGGSTAVFTFAVGDAFPFIAKSITVNSGTFSIGFD